MLSPTTPNPLPTASLPGTQFAHTIVPKPCYILTAALYTDPNHLPPPKNVAVALFRQKLHGKQATRGPR